MAADPVPSRGVGSTSFREGKGVQVPADFEGGLFPT